MRRQPRLLGEQLRELEEAVDALVQAIAETGPFGRLLLRVCGLRRRRPPEGDLGPLIAQRRRRLAVQMARCVPYDVETVDRVLELALGTGLTDPEEFLRRCSSSGLDPIETIERVRRIERADRAHRARAS